LDQTQLIAVVSVSVDGV